MTKLSLTAHARAAHPPEPASEQPAQHRPRHGLHELRPDPLAQQEVQALLSRAFADTRPRNWGRSAPSLHNWQETRLYALTPQGTFRYDARGDRLEPVNAADLRAAIGLQPAIGHAPLHLVYVCESEVADSAHAEEHGFVAGADAGAIVESVSRQCEATGLAAVLRGSLDRGHLARALGLSPTQRIVMVQSIGHPVPEAAA